MIPIVISPINRRGGQRFEGFIWLLVDTHDSLGHKLAHITYLTYEWRTLYAKSWYIRDWFTGMFAPTEQVYDDEVDQGTRSEQYE